MPKSRVRKRTVYTPPPPKTAHRKVSAPWVGPAIGACLIVGLMCALYAAVASLYGARTGRRGFVVSGRRAMYCLAGLAILAFAILQSAVAAGIAG